MKLIILSLSFLLAFASEGAAQRNYLPELYWVVESNIHYRNYTIVRFYDQENREVHNVKLMGVYVNICRPRQKKMLDQLLNELQEKMASEKSMPEVLDVNINKNLARKRQFSAPLRRIDRDLL